MFSNLDDCKFIKDIEVSWGEMDAFQHVNNVVYFRYFESARIAYLETIDYKRMAQASEVSVILASISAKFITPLFYPDLVKVGVKITDIKQDRFGMDYVLFSTKQDKVAAIGSSIIVTYNYKENIKVDIPPKLREKLL